MKLLKFFKFNEYKIRKFDFGIVLMIIALCVLGYFVLGSALAKDPDRDNILQKQLLGFALGGGAMLVLAVLDYHVLFRLSPLIYLGILGLLGAVLVAGVTLNEATRWVKIAGIQIQPSEFAKVGIIIIVAAFIDKYLDKINKPLYLAALLGIVAIPLALILAEPDLSTTIVVAVIFVCMLYVGKISYKWILGAVGVAIPIVGFMIYDLTREVPIFFETYQKNRIMSWLFPDTYASSGLTTQQDNSVMAISSGQLWGKGLNNTSFESVKNGNFLSEENNDFIFAIVGEELGFAGSMFIIVLMTVLALSCFKIAYKAKDIGGRVIAVGVGVTIGFQTFVNIGVSSGLLPNTGLPLPFISSGVSSLLCAFAAFGIVLNVGLQRRDRDADW